MTKISYKTVCPYCGEAGMAKSDLDDSIGICGSMSFCQVVENKIGPKTILEQSQSLGSIVFECFKCHKRFVVDVSLHIEVVPQKIVGQENGVNAETQEFEDEENFDPER